MLNKNLEIIRTKYPGIISTISNTDQQEYSLEIFAAKNGSTTGTINSIMLHSKYNPEREAERLTNDYDFASLSSIVVLGFGLGYHIVQLYQQIKEYKINLFIIETDSRVFREAMRHTDFTEIFASEKVHLLINSNPGESDLLNFIESRIDLVYDRMNICILPSFKKYGKNLPGIISELNYVIKKVNTNRSTIRQRSSVWEKNLLDNIRLLSNNAGIIGLKGRGVNKPAVIVSAGPSLNKNIHLLKKVKGRAVIIAIDAVLKTLLKNDIIPDIVAVLDGYQHTLKYFAELDYKQLNETLLIGLPQFYNSIFQQWPGPVLFSPSYGVGEDLIKWLEKLSSYKGRINTGGSVAHLAFGIANLMGADPVVFVGQDLAFTDGLTHVTGSDYSQKINNQMVENDRFFKIKDINGEDIWTRNDFYLFLQWFNNEIAGLKKQGLKTEYIDATEGGARINGTRVMTLQNVINKYLDRTINLKEIILNDNFNNSIDMIDKVLPDIRGLKDKIIEVQQLADRGLKIVEKLKGSDQVNLKLEKELNQINDRLMGLVAKVMLFKALIYDLNQIKVRDLSDDGAAVDYIKQRYHTLYTESGQAISTLDSLIKQ